MVEKTKTPKSPEYWTLEPFKPTRSYGKQVSISAIKLSPGAMN